MGMFPLTIEKPEMVPSWVTTTYWKGASAGPKMLLPSEAMPVGVARLRSPAGTDRPRERVWTPAESWTLTNPAPLSVMKKGCPGRPAIAQGLTKLGASLAAAPGTLDARFDWRKAFVWAVALSAINPDPARSTQQKNNANLCLTLPPPCGDRA